VACVLKPIFQVHPYQSIQFPHPKNMEQYYIKVQKNLMDVRDLNVIIGQD
jgi:hypothetical protein